MPRPVVRLLKPGLKPGIKPGLECRIKPGLKCRIKPGLKYRIEPGLKRRIKPGRTVEEASQRVSRSEDSADLSSEANDSSPAL